LPIDEALAQGGVLDLAIGVARERFTRLTTISGTL
jgi:hypothetical protein